MATNAIDAARAYINDAKARGIGAVSAVAVAKRLNVTEDQAVALLNFLVETEDLVRINGHINCPECSEQIVLKGTRLSTLIREAEQLAGRQCPFCGVPFPSAQDTKVHLSFFCLAAAPNLSDSVASIPKPAVPEPFVVTNLARLREIQGINCHNLIIASEGSTVLVGETVSQTGAGGVVAGIASGNNASLRDVTTESRDVVVNATPGVAQGAADTAPVKASSWLRYINWTVISVGVGIIAAVAGVIFIPPFPYRWVVITLLSVAVTVLCTRLNPIYWARWLIGVLVLYWMATTGLGVSGSFLADIPGYAKVQVVVNDASPAALFHISVAIVIGCLLLYDFKQRRL